MGGFDQYILTRRQSTATLSASGGSSKSIYNRSRSVSSSSLSASRGSSSSSSYRSSALTRSSSSSEEDEEDEPRKAAIPTVRSNSKTYSSFQLSHITTSHAPLSHLLTSRTTLTHLSNHYLRLNSTPPLNHLPAHLAADGCFDGRQQRRTTIDRLSAAGLVTANTLVPTASTKPTTTKQTS